MNIHSIEFCNKFFIVFRGDSTIQVLVQILGTAFAPHVYIVPHIVLSNLFILERNTFSALSLSKSVERQTICFY
jgi:hypothetical protein